MFQIIQEKKSRRPFSGLLLPLLLPSLLFLFSPSGCGDTLSPTTSTSTTVDNSDDHQIHGETNCSCKFDTRPDGTFEETTSCDGVESSVNNVTTVSEGCAQATPTPTPEPEE